MPSLLIPLALVFGACVGSFCNVVIIRLHQEKGVGGRSQCPHCRHQLQWIHLIPVFSWIMLGARCAFCRKPIHWQYPVVEAAGAAIMYVALIANGGGSDVTNWIGVLYTAFLLFTLLIITTFDMRWQLVPMEFTVAAGVLLGLWNAGMGNPLLVLVGAMATSLILGVIVWVSGGRLMGEGDPAVGFLIGAALGWPLGLVAVALSFLIGGCVAMVLLATGVVKRKTPVPFVPFLSAGAIVAYFHGAPLLDLFSYAFL